MSVVGAAFFERLHIELEHGLCVGVTLPPIDSSPQQGDLTALHPQERDFALELKPRRRISFVGGRIALRRAFAALGVDVGAMLPGVRGAPLVPEPYRASVSHKNEIAVALLGTGPGFLGIDIEEVPGDGGDVARYILTDDELSRLPAADPERRTSVLTAFSVKEALYKGLDPYVQRYVGFKEVELLPTTGDSLPVRMNLKGGEGPFDVELRCRRWEGYVLSSARVTAA